MIEITGEVDGKEKEQMQPPASLIFGKPNGRYIPVLKLRILTPSGNRIQVLYKGETLGEVDIGDQVTVKGWDKGGIIHAASIYNHTTNSWVTQKSTNCFIVTAVYGLNSAYEIRIFEKFRGEFLVKIPIGKWLISLYYRISPFGAALLRKNKLLRKVVRILFLNPVAKLINKFLLMKSKLK